MSRLSELTPQYPEGTLSPGSDTLTTPNYEGQGDSGKSKSSRRSVACKSCHGLKVKCTPSDIHNPSSPCVRCLNTSRKCEIDLNQTRKRRKKAEIINEKNALLAKSVEKSPAVRQDRTAGTAGTETETEPEVDTIAKLQNKIKMLEARLELQPQQTKSRLGNGRFNMADAAENFDSPPFVSKVDLESEIQMLSEISSKLTDLTGEIKDVADRRAFLLKDGMSPDMLSNNIITLEEARERLHIYKTKIYTAHPLVAVPDDMSVEELQEKQPFLLNSIMSVSNAIYDNSNDVDKSLKLDNFALQKLTIEVMVLGTKSDELIKSLLLLCLWYNTPELFKHRRYHLLNTISVTMLHDLGIITRPSYSYKNEDGAITANQSNNFHNTEYRSMILILYFTTVSICLILRRTIYVKWTPYVEECCTYLENTKIKRWVELAHFSRLSNLLDKIHHVLHCPDVSERRNSLYIISEFQNLLSVIRSRIREDDYPCLAYYYSVVAYLHEPVFGGVFAKDGETLILSEKSVKSIWNCTNASLDALRIFNVLKPSQVATIPLFYVSRVAYTAGILLRLRYLIISLPSHIEKDLVPQSALLEVQKTNKLIHDATIAHASNHFLKKTRLVMQLFIQTYATQAIELLRRSNDTPRNFPSMKGDMSDVDKLARMFIPRPYGNKPTSSEEEEVLNSPIPLDILSYAATFRREGSLGFNPEESSDLTVSGAINRPASVPQPSIERVRKENDDPITGAPSPGGVGPTSPRPSKIPMPKHIPILGVNGRGGPFPPNIGMNGNDGSFPPASPNGFQPNLIGGNVSGSFSGPSGIPFPSRPSQSYPSIQAHAQHAQHPQQFPPFTQFQGQPMPQRQGLVQLHQGGPRFAPPLQALSPHNQSFDAQQFQGTANASINNLKGVNSNLANADQLENSYWALNDEFWVDLLCTESDRLNFSSNNHNNSQINEEVFFMN